MKTKCPYCGKIINLASIMGKKGGKVKSLAKTLSCRINSRKGGQKTKEMWAKRKKAFIAEKPIQTSYLKLKPGQIGLGIEVGTEKSKRKK